MAEDRIETKKAEKPSSAWDKPLVIILAAIVVFVLVSKTINKFSDSDTSDDSVPAKTHQAGTPGQKAWFIWNAAPTLPYKPPYEPPDDSIRAVLMVAPPMSGGHMVSKNIPVSFDIFIRPEVGKDVIVWPNGERSRAVRIPGNGTDLKNVGVCSFVWIGSPTNESVKVEISFRPIVVVHPQ